MQNEPFIYFDYLREYQHRASHHNFIYWLKDCSILVRLMTQQKLCFKYTEKDLKELPLFYTKAFSSLPHEKVKLSHILRGFLRVEYG